MIEVLTKLIKTIIMLKNISKLEGAQKLTKNEQKKVVGGACHPLGLVGYINGVNYIRCYIV
jgi:hypothetical protein